MGVSTSVDFGSLIHFWAASVGSSDISRNMRADDISSQPHDQQ